MEAVAVRLDSQSPPSSGGTAAQQPEVTLPFTSPLPKVGDPSLDWEEFKHPKLRRFPRHSDINLGRFIGRGVDGLVIKARLRGSEDCVAVKIVSGQLTAKVRLKSLTLCRLQFEFNHQPPPIDAEPYVHIPDPLYELRYRRKFQPRPPRPPLKVYWPFERECMNAALLEMIQASLQDAAKNNKHIHLNPSPKTRNDALKNLRAFSTYHSSHQEGKSDNLTPFSPNVRINGCRGWTQFQGHDINNHLIATRAECCLDLKDEETYYAIVYDYVSKGDRNPGMMLEW
ncbi:hypothetical protein AK830_g10644 [Neonectria ditissima]|uniref:Protein kinase domain-containing protein n=1 Tax=Neonectria ditissima TaxID=78410 RepID=A0A0P7API1_9HYPO|nr:hypothetical protein AK830_g10644 [Neonectria ditissima]